MYKLFDAFDNELNIGDYVMMSKREGIAIYKIVSTSGDFKVEKYLTKGLMLHQNKFYDTYKITKKVFSVDIRSIVKVELPQKYKDIFEKLDYWYDNKSLVPYSDISEIDPSATLSVYRGYSKRV
jgi:hypothetical protein